MMKKTGLRIIAILMTLALLLTTVPVSVFAMAAEATEIATEQETSVQEADVSEEGDDVISDAWEADAVTEVSEITEEPVQDVGAAGDIDGFLYEVSEDGVTITKYTGGASAVVIPDSIEGIPVTSIRFYAFWKLTSLTSITIPDSVTSIGDYAFEYCTSLTSVTIGNSVTSIGISTFKDCTSLTSITIPDSVTYIENLAFYKCTSLTSVTIGNSVTSIGNSTFKDCTSLTSVIIPNSVTNIGEGAFENCTSLSSVTIGNSVTKIGNNTFYGCTSLTSATIGNSVTSIGNSSFEGCTGLTSITISDSVTSIGNSSFEGCSGLTSITIGNSVTSIGNSTFKDCTSLTSVIIPNSVTNIGKGAFENCTSLASVTIGNSVTKIRDNTFYGCTSLTSATIGNSVTSIGNSSFEGCTGLTSITIPDSVTSIGWSAFSNCTSLTSITIPDSVTSIGDWAFKNCTSLTSVTIPNSVTSIEWYAFENCTSLTSITIPDSVTSIERYAFKNCTSLTSITIPDSVTRIGERAFSNCTGLTSVTIGDSVTSIGSSAFGGCTSLTSVIIPNSVTSIGEGAFSRVLNLKYSGSATGSPWGAKHLNAFEENGVVYDSSQKTTLLDVCFGIQNVVIPNSVTSIGEEAFYSCDRLTSVTIPDSVTSIGERAFYWCTSLTSVTIGNGVSQIRDNTFYGCTSLTSVTIGNSVTSIGAQVFMHCTSLTNITIPDSVTSIEYEAFWNCTSLTSVTIGNGVTSIGDFAFTYCTSLTSVSIGNNVMSIGDCAFADCSSLTGIIIPDSVTRIVEEAFYYCTNLRTVVLGKGLKSVGSSAFSGCTNIKNVFYAGTRADWDAIRFSSSADKTALQNAGIHYESGVDFYPVQGLRCNREEKGLSFSWDAHLNDRIVQYDISKNGEWVGTTFDCAFYAEDDLSEAATYTVNGVAADGKKTQDASIEVYIPQQIINVTAVGDYYDIKLSWSKSNEVHTTVYQIYRSVDAQEDFTLLKTISGRETLTYTDKAVEDEKTYRYYVVAINDIGAASEPSEIVVGQKCPDTEPPTVTKFTPGPGIITGTQRLTISAVDNVKPTSVKLYYSTDENTWTLLGEDNAPPFNFDFDTTVLSDSDVFLKAVAYDAKKNESEPMIRKYRTDNTGPEQVTGLRTKAVYTSQITLEWNDVTADDAACYILQQKKSDGTWTTISSSITTLGYNLSELKPDFDYKYRVAAKDVRGNVGKYSETLTVHTEVDNTPPVITSLAPSPGRYNNSIRFSSRAGDDCGIAAIDIQVSSDAKTWTTVSTAAYTTLYKTASYAYTLSLKEYTDGSIFIRAVATDSSGNKSDESDEAAYIEYIVDKSAPNKPRDLIASGGDGWICISWIQGEESDLGAYSLYRATAEDGHYSMIASDLHVINYYDTTAKRDTIYYYKLRVLDTTGNISDFSEAASAKVADDIIPPEVVSVNPASGSFVGPAYKTIEALVKDNNCLQSVTIEYRINDETEFTILKQFDNIGRYYTTVRTDLPIKELENGDKVHIRVVATDICGIASEYSSVYTYVVDAVAPTLTALSAQVEDDNIKLTWKDGTDTDVAGYKVYRVLANGSFSALGSRSVSSMHAYTFYDSVYSEGTGDYAYIIESFDRVGNFNRFFTDPVHYEKKVVNKQPEPEIVIEKENAAPVVVLKGCAVMEVGVEEFFDAGYSTDDNAIQSFRWDFGDGTSSNQVKAIKKYSRPGTYTVTLTLMDDEGAISSKTLEVQVNERVAVGKVKVQVLDEDGKVVAGAPVYFDLGTDQVKKISTDNSGYASLNLEKGDHQIGVYKSGYLPVQKTVTVLPNATRIVTMTIIQQELVTGKFEVTRMTFNEIKEAGIDVYAPANRQLYQVEVKIKYGGSTIPIKYIRNETQILTFSVEDSGGTNTAVIQRRIADIVYIPSIPSGDPSDAETETIAVLDVPVQATYLKEFFDVRLHIVNNATTDFKLTNNTIQLHIPDGLTLMGGLKGDWSSTPEVKIDTIIGQETKTIAWVLRGDKDGEYDLTADYDGVLMPFNEPYHTKFVTDEPIKVYGLSSMKMIVEVNNEIRYNALYFNFALQNVGAVDIYNPMLDFDGIVKNITASARQKDSGISDKEKEDFDVISSLQNVRVQYHDGTTQYIPFQWNADGTVSICVDTLSPGDSIYYEYVAYNVVNYDGLAHFMDAAKEVTAGIADNVEVKAVTMSLYNSADALTSLPSFDKKAVSFMTNDTNFYYWNQANSDDTLSNSIGRVLNNCAQLVFDFNWDVLTGKQKEELAESILLQLLTSQNVMDNVEDVISKDSVTAVTSYLSLVRSAISNQILDYDDFFKEYKKLAVQEYEEMDLITVNGDIIIFDSVEYSYETFDAYLFEEGQYKLYQSAQLIGGMISNYRTIDKLVKVLQKEGPENTIEKIKEEVAKGLGAVGMTGLNWYFRDALSENELVNTISQTCKFTSKIINVGILNTIKAFNKAEYNQTIYNAIQANACIEEELNILDAIINGCKNSSVNSDFKDELLKAAKHYKEVAKDKAGTFEAEVLGYYLEYTAGSVITDVASWGRKKLLAKLGSRASVIFTIMGLTYDILNEKIGFSQRFKSQDGLDIADCMGSILKEYWLVCQQDAADHPDDYEKAVLAVRAMKYLIQTRLLGEALFKDYIENIDEGFIKELNKEHGTNYKDVEAFYDVVCKAILEHRDVLYNIKDTSSVVKPDAPAVTFNYDTLQTNETFDNSFEYCLSDGEWVRCTGSAISVKPKTNTTVLRVRKASGSGTIAGEITTVTIDARRELSKTISVRYDAGTYSFQNLLSVYDYEIVPLQSQAEMPNWSKAYKVHGGTGATVSGNYGKYLAIRSCPNAELRETVSQVRILTVATRQSLTVTTWGNGSVQQPREDSQYFVGEDIVLTAVPAEGAIFRGWFIGSEQVSNDTQYTLEMSAYGSISAKFEGGQEATSVKLDLVGADEAQAQSFLQKVWNFVTAQDDPEISVFENSAAKLKITVEPANAAEQDVTWTTSNSEVATVDETGTIRFLKAGMVSISATLADGITNSYSFTVLPNNVEELTLTGEAEKTSYYEHEKVLLDGLTVVATYSSGKTEVIEAAYTVEPTTLNTAGTQVITVMYAGQSASFEVEVLHSGEWTVTKEANCSETGLEEYRCLICEELLEIKEIPSLDHDCIWVVTQESTPNKPGTRSFICQNCNEVIETKEIIWCDHTFEAEVTEPKCDAQGYTTYTCSKCGDVVIGNYTDVLEHQYDAKIVEASCGKVGYTVYTCSVCGDVTFADKTAALEHNYVEQAIEATCKNVGCIKHTCTNCGDSYDTDVTEEIPHAYTIVVTKPTCTQGGFSTYTCSMCGDTYTSDEADPIGHNYTDTSVNGNCEQGGYVLHTCSVCEHSEKEYFREAKEHVFGAWMIRRASDEERVGLKYRICIICDCEETVAIPIADHEHTPGNWYTQNEASCAEYGIRAQKCTQCSEVIQTEKVEVLDHSFKQTVTPPTCVKDGFTTHTCSVCSYSYSDTIVSSVGQHNPGEWVTEPATCTENGKRVRICTECNEQIGEELLPATNHPNQTWTTTSEPTCAESGVREKKCKDCGETVDKETIAPLGHRYSAEVTAPTCTEDGYTTFTCSICGDGYQAESTASIGHHTPGDWIVETEATCTETGKKVQKCTVCEAVLDEQTIPANGHTPGEWHVVKNSTNTECGKEEQRCTVCQAILHEREIAPDLQIQTPSTNKIRYGKTLILHLPENLQIPAGASIEWTADGSCVKTEKSEDGKTFEVTSDKTGTTTICAKIVDSASGKVLKESNEITLTSKAGFFQKLRYWIEKIFGKNHVIPQALDYLDRYYDIF